MRHVVFAVLAACWLVARAGAQTPEPVRDEPKPHGEPVKDPQPHGEPIHDGPHGEPVPPENQPKNEPPKNEPPKNEPPKNQQPTSPAKGTSQPPGTKPGSAPTGTPPNGGTTPPNGGTKPADGGTTPPSGGTKIPAGPAVKPATPVQPLPPEPPPPPSSIGSGVTTIGPQPLGAGDIPISGAEIRQIIVEDNKKTTSDTVTLIAQIEVGDTWTPDMVDTVRQRLVSSGLFKDVEVYYTKTDGGVSVHILAMDMHSWVIAPAFYNQPTNVGGGVGFGENN
ncbi:MAG TPA: POTRA domain-containing protein, partial [Kofleriaceae bacterium]|nr:POTRA domain-containing protein [Kofleriaceae bacterium]